LDKNTILRLMVQAGEQCFQFLADTMQNLQVADVQVDEVFSFVACKEKTAFLQNAGDGCGDAYAFTAIDRSTKLLFCFHIGRRDAENASLFADKVAMCVADGVRPHVSTDGFNPYHTAIPAAFGHRVDHGMLIKQFGGPSQAGQRRYSPATIIGAKHYQNAGTSKPGQICTSHIERSNLTIRMQNRRWTRLTNASSKKWENHQLMFALFVAWYNGASYCHTSLCVGKSERLRLRVWFRGGSNSAFHPLDNLGGRWRLKRLAVNDPRPVVQGHAACSGPGDNLAGCLHPSRSVSAPRRALGTQATRRRW
jgi:IS1 family transposase